MLPLGSSNKHVASNDPVTEEGKDDPEKVGDLSSFSVILADSKAL